jgi:hypothetical protein
LLHLCLPRVCGCSSIDVIFSLGHSNGASHQGVAFLLPAAAPSFLSRHGLLPTRSCSPGLRTGE